MLLIPTPKVMKTVKIMLLLCVCVLSVRLNAQEKEKLDSLLTVLKSMPSDTAKVNLYGQICRAYTIDLGDFELANTYLDSVKILSNRLRYENGRIHSFFLGSTTFCVGRLFEMTVKHLKISSLCPY